ncbi:MAG: HEAT repeat domain-containing protein [Syntrophotalea sp.]
MTTESPPQQSLDLALAALTRLIKLIKAVRFYPPEHPTLKLVGDETLEAFRPLLQNGNLAVTVRKDGILHQGETIGRSHGGIRSLAHFLFARRIQQLLFLPELTVRDLMVFSRNVVRKTSDIQQQGGLQEALLAEQATGIWINEIDLSVIRDVKQRLQQREEALSAGSEETSESENKSDNPMLHQEGIATEACQETAFDKHLLDQLSLEQVLVQLPREASENRFRQLLGVLPDLVRRQLVNKDLTLVLQTYRTLAGLHGNRRINQSRRSEIIKCLDLLTRPDIIAFLIEALCNRTSAKNLRLQTMQTLIFLRYRTILPLIERLTEENDPLARKFLSTALVEIGTPAVPDLLRIMTDERWYVIRNIVAILGQIGSQHAVPYLKPLLWHKDLRIARESVRALARIGGAQALEALLQLIDSGQQDLYPQAIIALGIMRDPMAVSKLVGIMTCRDPFRKKTEMKIAAIKALGRIGCIDAAPDLERMAKRRFFWSDRRRAALRIQAIAALGQIRAPASRPVLETISQERDQRIAQCAARTLKLWPDRYHAS